MIKIAVAGCCGRMGMSIARLVQQDSQLDLVGAFEVGTHPSIGKDFGTIIGGGDIDVPITSDIREALKGADCLIDFTSPLATLENIKIIRELKKKIVVGTTGIGKKEMEFIQEASKEIPLVVASNMSLGVNLLFHLVKEVSQRLSKEYQIEIMEMHHQFKKDSPSGTALSLAQEIVDAKGVGLDQVAVYGREGKDLSRKEDEIGIHAIRAGNIVGEHTVMFCSENERLELTHRAYSRDTFAAGSLIAAKFLKDKECGLFNMKDVLNI